MDYKAMWINLRNELYDIVKRGEEMGIDAREYSNVLLKMIGQEDSARGVDVLKRHIDFRRDLTLTDVISIYESQDREN